MTSPGAVLLELQLCEDVGLLLAFQLGSVHHNFHHRFELTWYLLAIFHTLTTASCASGKCVVAALL